MPGHGITVVQPWAWGIINGVLTSHHFGRRTTEMGPILVHAAKTRQFLTPASCRQCPGVPSENRLVFGAFIGVVDVADCTRDGSLWLWTFERPRAIVPIPFDGGFGRFVVSPEIIGQIQYVEPALAIESP